MERRELTAANRLRVLGRLLVALVLLLSAPVVGPSWRPAGASTLVAINGTKLHDTSVETSEHMYDHAIPFARRMTWGVLVLGGRVRPLTHLVRTNARAAVEFFAPQTADDLVDLTTPAARRHILDGEVRPEGSFSGGHRPGTGFSGKSEFPGGWSDGRVLHEISDIATDPAATRVVQGSRTIVTGSRNGVDIRVVIDNRTGQIVTGYPTNLPRNP